MSKAISIPCFGHSQKWELRRLFYHPLANSKIQSARSNQTKVEILWALCPPFPKPDRIRTTAHCWPKRSKQGRDLICTRYRMGDIGNNVIEGKEHDYPFWKVTFNRLSGHKYLLSPQAFSPTAFLPCAMQPQASGPKGWADGHMSQLGLTW